ncbi:YidC/Oxa1 family membrane protein insertase [Kitasatospora sp. NBC_00240]|uniref:YidC/Oxa1 family membrane protein insertase n=1 Tax=Kitasatospora sp. NBC_00240 TaxID=2903567 RepID=UPI00225A6187|nr:YidC/Oxa1 family membrane protein insertase [Kitasatospora sp. NBC_00240]MCX5212739.1 YidC/Oxa1 family membrane protein insertase [Kitasatospora sp. NBC_00240]
MSVLSILDPAVGLAHTAVSALAHVLPTAVAIILFTVCVRLALHPLARAAARGEKARTRLAPQVAELNRKHKGKPEKLKEALAELYREEKASPFAGCLPMLVQIPFFSVMYRLFTTPNDLLDHTVLGVPLGMHVSGAHGPAQLAVFGALYAALAAVGYANFRRARRTGLPGSTTAAGAPPAPGAALLPYLSFGTVLFAALVPLAAGLYLVTTTAWSSAERAWLHRGTPAPVLPAVPDAGPAKAAEPVKATKAAKAAKAAKTVKLAKPAQEARPARDAKPGAPARAGRGGGAAAAKVPGARKAPRSAEPAAGGAKAGRAAEAGKAAKAR